MEKIRLSLSEINPYVRTANFSSVNRNKDFTGCMAYDCRLIYIYSGKGIIKLNDRPYPAEKGCLFLWQAGVAYDFISEADSSIRLVNLNFDFVRKFDHIKTYRSSSKYLSILEKCNRESFDPKKALASYDFGDFPLFNAPVAVSCMQKSEDSLSAIVREFNIREPGFELVITSLITGILSEVVRRSLRNRETSGNNRRINEILDYIHMSYDEKLDNSSLAKRFSYHPVYLNRIMAKHTGKPLHSYITEYRITKALGLLQSSGKSIKEIAADVGFDNSNYFSKCFKRITGISPSQYIRNSTDNL
ncbi:MAG: AraC family transcriptional regulator [Eubacteriales bacterium]|nr:AraC family transcriptional regulator [Eubacteriales bacterium]